MGIFGSPKTDTGALTEASAARERERLAREAATAKATADQRATRKAAEALSARRAFAGSLAASGDEEPSGRRYLQSV